MGKKREKQYKYLKVTSTALYVVEMVDGVSTAVNGWTPDEVVDDWFRRFDLNRYHCSREGALLGNTTKVVDVEILDDIDEYADQLRLDAVRRQGVGYAKDRKELAFWGLVDNGDILGLSEMVQGWSSLHD